MTYALMTYALMRLRDVIILFICIVVAASLLIIAGMRLDYINSQRQQMRLIINEPLENAPPSLAFATVAMGAFRGLVVDVLWMRADKLKEEGQFFDAKQLAEWITILQPRFAAVWEFQAWNMAYNISVAIPATQPDQRWLWVKNGYELLRDRAIKYNPHNITLYRELARIFQHKIGEVSDDAHKYYKLQLAEAMEPLLGPADNEYFDNLSSVAKSLWGDEDQVNWNQVWQKILNDANVAPLISALKSADQAFSADENFIRNYLLLRQNAGRFNPAAGKTIDDFRGTDTLKKFDIIARAYHLRSDWKLEPALMNELNKTYGPIDWSEPNKHLPLDWRHPDTHALYWAIKGLKVAARNENRQVDADEANADRFVGYSLQDLFRYGKIFIYNEPVQTSQDDSSQTSQKFIKDIFLRPDLRMFEPYNNAVLTILKKYKELGDRRRLEAMQNGHRNMLKNAVLSFYQSGHREQAQKIYDQLKQLYPRPEFDVPLVVFARNRLIEELKNIEILNAREQIMALLIESYYLYAIRDDDSSFGQEKLAKEIYDYYNASYSEELRINLPEFSLLRYLALMDFLYDQQYPVYLRQSLINRIKIERPELAKQLEQQEQTLIKQQKQAK